MRTRFHGLLVQALAICTGFPHKPWLSCSLEERKKFSKLVQQIPRVAFYSSNVMNPPLALDLKEPENMSLGTWKKLYQQKHTQVSEKDPILFGFFAINLDFAENIISDLFQIELSRLRPKPANTRPKGRHSIRDALKALGALRLRYYYRTFPAMRERMKHETKSLTKTGKARGLYYAHPESLRRACQSAVKHFQRLYAWIDRGMPIHFKQSNRMPGQLEQK